MRSVTIQKGNRSSTFNDVEAIRFVAHLLEVSEYEVFQMGFCDWYGKRMDESSMDYRFENYLDEEIVPFWAWRFAQDVIEKYEKGRVRPADYGITPRKLSSSEKIMGWFIVTGVLLFAFVFALLARTVEL